MKRILRPATVAAPVSSWLCCVVVGAIAGAAGAAAAAPSTLSSYHVGNSLTWDSSPNMVAAMAAQRGHAQTVGYHIACGQSLTSITGGDPWTCVPTNSFGMYDTALPQNAWDAITAEPYTGSTLGGEAAAFAQLMQLATQNPANAHTQWYVYEAYPNRLEQQPDYAAAWLRPSSGADDEATQLSRAYFSNLLPRLNALRPAGLPALRAIPVGDANYEAERRARLGQLNGVTDVGALYRDADHLSVAGQFLAASTVYATLFAEDPTGIAFPSQFYDGYVLDPVLTSQLESLAWDVVSTHPDTGVTPEPASVGLVLLPVAAAALTRRRRRAA
jgi:hypothetical protein